MKKQKYQKSTVMAVAAFQNTKVFAAFLNGVNKKLFEKDLLITNEFLKEQLFKSNEAVSTEGNILIRSMLDKVVQYLTFYLDVAEMVNKCEETLKKASYNDWDLSTFENNLKEVRIHYLKNN